MRIFFQADSCPDTVPDSAITSNIALFSQDSSGMNKTVLDVGNCGPDHSAICRLLSSHFNVRILQAHGLADTLDFLGKDKVDLVLINRKLDQDYSDGMEILKALKADHRFAKVPAMIISNYEEVQKSAVELGGLHGFGKLSLSNPQTIERLSAVLN